MNYTYRFWGINNTKRAISILLKAKIKFKIVEFGDEYLSKKLYDYTRLEFRLDEADLNSQKIISDLKECMG